MSSSISKRALDLLIITICLPPATVLTLVAALIIAFNDGLPISFRQERVGRFERIFRLYKLRSMTSEVDADGNLLPDAERLTAWGHFLRSSSLDELPQLWNVLVGDMSLVGPRPLPVRYLPRYTGEQRRRHLVRPGITGWAQVNGRNNLTWQQKFEMDVWYVDHQNLRLDLKILWLTALKVIRRDDISQHGHATMPEFRGDAPSAPPGSPGEL